MTIMRSGNTSSPPSDNERGTALIWALLFVIVTSGLVVSHTTYMAARRGERDARYNRASLAETFARSGLQDAVGWFHRRSNQPVTAFDPVYDPAGTPPRIDTIDPKIGLVREFEINGSLWGRYEVRHGEAVDITAQRGDLPPGSVWEIGVRSFVYRKRDAAKPFGAAPNELVATKALSTEMRWLQMNPPAPAAICVDDPSKLTVGGTATIDGGTSVAIAYRDPATMETPPTRTTPTINAMARISGALSQLAAPNYEAYPERVFTMRLDELAGYSDAALPQRAVSGTQTNWWDLWRSWWESQGWQYGGSGSGSTQPPPIDSKVIYAKGFDLNGKLRLANSLLVIDGDLTDQAGSETTIDGLVYVSGDAVLDSGAFELNGVMIVRGQARLGTGLLSRVKLTYNGQVLDDTRRTAGKYRARRTQTPGQ
jgi:hypothetical protein